MIQLTFLFMTFALNTENVSLILPCFFIGMFGQDF
jgi:hypothetical protein